mmetsp:Transcript_16454/g.44583  ORF Transcript_16454/g.44583 Transcript_16454/m.44583 type:complete len:620 (+) Transcript_16454:183-2042(+)
MDGSGWRRPLNMQRGLLVGDRVTSEHHPLVKRFGDEFVADCISNRKGNGDEIPVERRRRQREEVPHTWHQRDHDGQPEGNAAGHVHPPVPHEHLPHPRRIRPVPWSAAHGVRAHHLTVHGSEKSLRASDLGALCLAVVVCELRLVILVGEKVVEGTAASPTTSVRGRRPPVLQRALVRAPPRIGVGCLARVSTPSVREEVRVRLGPDGPGILLVDPTLVRDETVPHGAELATVTWLVVIHLRLPVTLLILVVVAHTRGGNGRAPISILDRGAEIFNLIQRDGSQVQVQRDDQSCQDGQRFEEHVGEIAVEPPVECHDVCLLVTGLDGHDSWIGRFLTDGHSGASVAHQIQEDDLQGLQGNGQRCQDRDGQVQDLANVGAQKERHEFLNVGIDLSTLLHGHNNGHEVVVEENHVGCTLGNVRPSDAHGNPNVRSLEGWRIVHAVTSHAADQTHALQRMDDGDLVLWLRPAEHVDASAHLVENVLRLQVVLAVAHVGADDNPLVHVLPLLQKTDLPGDGHGRGLLVPRDHHHTNACGTTRLDGSCDARAWWILIPNEAEEARPPLFFEPRLSILRLGQRTKRLQVVVAQGHDASTEHAQRLIRHRIIARRDHLLLHPRTRL